nr:DMT family transporter [Tissierella sp.]
MKLVKDKRSILADFSLVLVAIIWGSGFIFMKNTLEYLDPVHIISLRFIISFIVMALIFFKKLKTISLRDLKAGAIIGLFLFAAFLSQTVGLQYTTVSNQAFITASNVVLVPYLYWFISKNKPKTSEIMAVILCFIGIGILSIEKGFNIGLGDGLTMICAVFFACHIVSIGLYSKKHDPIVLIIIQFGVAGILCLLTAFIMKTPFKPMTEEVTFSILYMSLVGTILAFGIQNIAQKYTSSTHAALILSTESVFGSLFAIFLLGEKLTIKLIIGSLLVLISIIIAEAPTRETKLNKKHLNL